MCADGLSLSETLIAARLYISSWSEVAKPATAARTPNSFVIFILVLISPFLIFSQVDTEVSGLIIPRDNDGMYVRNKEGQVEVNWTSKTKVALVVEARLLGGLKGDRLTYKIHSSKEVVIFSIPKGPITGIKTSRGGKQLERTFKEAREEKWLSEGGLKLYSVSYTHLTLPTKA